MTIHEEGNVHNGISGEVPAADHDVEEAADFVHPVDHGAGTVEEPSEREPAGSFVTGGGSEHPADLVSAVEEKGDYVDPVDHGDGETTSFDEDAGDYTDTDRGKR